MALEIELNEYAKGVHLGHDRFQAAFNLTVELAIAQHRGQIPGFEAPASFWLVKELAERAGLNDQTFSRAYQIGVTHANSRNN